MTAVTESRDRTRDERRVPERTIKWGSGPVAFELVSPDDDILEAAGRVFARWQPSANANVIGRWHASRIDGEFVVNPRRPPEDGSELQTIRDAMHAVAVVEYSAIWETVQSSRDLLCFHAALLSSNGRGVAIVGPSHAGKSTLAAGLWQRGWRFHCDDLTLIDQGRAFAGPRRASLRNECRAQVGNALWERVQQAPSYFDYGGGCLFQPMDLDDLMPQDVKLCGVVFLKRSGAVPAPGLKEIDGAHGALALLPYTNVALTQPFNRAVSILGQLAGAVRFWDLPRAPLDEMVEVIERAVAIGQ